MLFRSAAFFVVEASGFLVSNAVAEDFLDAFTAWALPTGWEVTRGAAVSSTPLLSLPRLIGVVRAFVLG